MTPPKDPEKREAYIENQRKKHLKENMNPDTLTKMSIAKKGIPKSEDFKQKRRNIMLDRWKDPKFKLEMSIKHTGENNGNYKVPISDGQRAILSKCASERVGDKNSNWSGGNTVFRQLIRGLKKYKMWCYDVYKNEQYCDRFTGVKGTSKTIDVHHIISLSSMIKIENIRTMEDVFNSKLLWDITNGILISRIPHNRFHNLYGDNHNIYELTPEQIQELYA